MTPAARVVGLVAVLQFVYILDFMAVLPLGPDLARALGFGADRLGVLSAAYTAGSIAAGLLSLGLIDRVTRRPALLVLLTLFGASTLATCFATGYVSLLALRALTGFIGGPMVAIGMAMVIDRTPPEQRGQAIGRVMLGFSLAAIAGVPAALELSARGDWRWPFAAVAAVCALLGVAMAWGLPRAPVPSPTAPSMASTASGWRALLRQPRVRRACALQAAAQFSAFLVIPSFSAYYLMNLGLPRDELGRLYLAGGLGALVMLQAMGRCADRYGPGVAVALSTAAVACGLLPFLGLAAWPLVLPFVAFMAGNAGRNVSIAALNSRVPAPHERAGFMSLQSMVQDLAMAAAALVSTAVVGVTDSGALAGMSAVAWLALAVSVALALGLRRERAQRGLPAAP